MVRARARVAALHLGPVALWAARRAAPTGAPVIVTEGGRVRCACPHAQAAGITPGMRLSGALSRVPTLHAVTHSGPAVAAAWAGVIAELPAFSPRVEVTGEGQALLTLTDAGAAALASALHAAVGVADTRELARLAAHVAPEGSVRAVPAGTEGAFRAALPLSALRGVGLSAAQAERLGWLGVTHVGQLLAWSRAQQAAFLGPEYAALRPYLHGAASGGVPLARPEPTVTATLHFGEPLFEPRDLHPACAQLAATLHADLGSRRPARLTVQAHAAGVTLGATRDLKEDARDPATLRRAVQAALRDTQAAPLGVDALHVTLSGLNRPARQDDLWGRAQAQAAADLAEARFPGCLRRVRWIDPHSLAPTGQFEWVPRRAAPTPANPAPAKPTPPDPHPLPDVRAAPAPVAVRPAPVRAARAHR